MSVLGTTCRMVCPGPANCVYCVLSVQSMVSYVHRIGRTGRAGKAGEAITLYTEQDMVRPDKSRCSGPAMWIRRVGSTTCLPKALHMQQRVATL